MKRATTSDGGVVLLREVDRTLGLTDSVARAQDDSRRLLMEQFIWVGQAGRLAPARPQRTPLAGRNSAGPRSEKINDTFGRNPMMAIVRAGVVYFILVFGAGFVLGVIRTLWVEPQVGARLAELLEMPVMLGVIVVAARWTIRRLAVPVRPSRRLGVGFVGLGLLIAAELALVIALRGMTLQDYFATRDPVTGTLYYLMLAVFALMPLLGTRK